MSDTICRYGGSIYQHGPHNDRIYLMKISLDDVPDIIHFFEELSQKNRYSKIFVKVPASAYPEFLSRGYRVEGKIPGLYRGLEDGFFMARYIDERRCRAADMNRIRELIRECVKKAGDYRRRELPEEYTLQACHSEDAEDIAALYGQIFESYPFPIQDPGYISATMQDNFRYFSVRNNGEIVTVASTEINRQDKNAEMTDFATDRRHSGLNLAGHLLEWMENEMKDEGIRVAFTIARALSFPINITFARAGYRYGGTLLNNTHICGSFESMNVWSKTL
ncbi:MAG TPA: putative beta-lysine N-acetyltransferase [Methanoregulaceae archaeon]|nr:putative beta-lysine N-acetyltransferase [Methanoregulaceae archaeon]